MKSSLVCVSAILLLALAACASGAPNLFIGGNFYQAGAVFSNYLAVYDTTSTTWVADVPSPGSNNIVDLAPAGNGVLAVGSFSNIHGTTICSIAYFDGSKWCGIRQVPLSGGSVGTVSAVACDTATSCYVAGTFDHIDNVPQTQLNTAVNFAHYTYDSTLNEWVYDAASGWGSVTTTLGAGAVSGSLLIAPSNTFFVALTSGIYRGRVSDDGWFVVTQAYGTAVQYSFDRTNFNLYTLVATVPTTLHAGVFCASTLTDAKATLCDTTAKWNDWLAQAADLATFSDYKPILYAASGDTRYLIGKYAPHPTNTTSFTGHYQVLKQSGASSLPVPVGTPFYDGADLANSPFTQLSVDENNRPLVLGSFKYANQYYPANTDDLVFLAGVRFLDRVSTFAYYDSASDSWKQAFGGGLKQVSSPLFTYNSAVKRWFIYAADLTVAYNIHADALGYYDDDSTLVKNFIPLFSHHLATRAEAGPAFKSATVYDVTYDSTDFSSIFVGGDFGYHGKDDIGGAVVQIAMQSNAAPVITAVGGGLFNDDLGITLPTPSAQLYNGVVFALARRDNYLYAGGQFARGKTGYVCLNNIARINVDPAVTNAVWEDLGGGCNNFVYDLEFYQNTLYAAGEFVQCGGKTVLFVASYDGASNTWASLHNGLNAPAYSLENFQGRLIAGGQFTHAGGLPAHGVASWNGLAWRALLPDCSDSCEQSSFSPSYFTVLQNPSAAVSLKTDTTGNYLYAVVKVGGAALLGRWEYTNGDLGQWTVKSDFFDFTPTLQPNGKVIANNGSSVVVGGFVTRDSPYGQSSGVLVHTYNTELENWLPSPLSIGYLNSANEHITVVRDMQITNSGSGLVAPLTWLLRFFF